MCGGNKMRGGSGNWIGIFFKSNKLKKEEIRRWNSCSLISRINNVKIVILQIAIINKKNKSKKFEMCFRLRK